LTISPKLLEELKASNDKVEKKLEKYTGELEKFEPITEA